jgi:phosphoglycolate phosphatase-like HAD superfamily hydrolase
VTIELTVDIGGTILQTEEAICAALNEAGVCATAQALQRFDADGEPIVIGGEKGGGLNGIFERAMLSKATLNNSPIFGMRSI